MSVFESREESIGDRMDALKATRKAEAPKVSPKVVHLQQPTISRKEAWRAYERSDQQTKSGSPMLWTTTTNNGGPLS
jgi:hypothetical protein